MTRIQATRAIFLLFIGCLPFVTGCNLEQMGASLGRGVATGVESRADSIAQRAMEGVDRGLTESELRAYIASLTDTIGAGLEEDIVRIRQELLGDSTRRLVASLRSELTGPATREEVRLLVDEAVNAQLRAGLLGLRNELLGDSLRLLLGNIRDDLTGPVLQANVALIAEALLTEVAESYVEKLRPAIREDITFAGDRVEDTGNWLRRNLTRVLIAAGLIIAGLIALVAYFRMNRNKHKELIEVLTSRIEKLQAKDPTTHDELTEAIHEKAVDKNLEPMLRGILKEQGIVAS